MKNVNALSALGLFCLTSLTYQIQTFLVYEEVGLPFIWVTCCLLVWWILNAQTALRVMATLLLLGVDSFFVTQHLLLPYQFSFAISAVSTALMCLFVCFLIPRIDTLNLGQRFEYFRPLTPLAGSTLAALIYGASMSLGITWLSSAATPFIFLSLLLSFVSGALLFGVMVMAVNQLRQLNPRNHRSVIKDTVALLLFTFASIELMVVNDSYLSLWISLYLPLPALLWAIYRMKWLGAGMASLMIVLCGAIMSVYSFGPLSNFPFPDDVRLLSMQLYSLMVLTITLAMLGVVMTRERAEKALQASRSLLEQTQQAAGLGRWSWDRLSGKAHLSSVLKEVLGFEEPDFNVSTSLLDYIHPTDRRWLVQTFLDCFATAVPWSGTARILTRDGEEKNLLISWTFEQGEDGELVRVLGTAQDISEKLRIHQAITYYNRFKEIMMAISSEFIICDVKGLPVLFDKALDEVTRFLDADIGLVFKKEEESQLFEMQAISRQPVFEGRPLPGIELFEEGLLDRSLKTLETGGEIYLDDIERLAGDSRELAFYQKLGIHSLINVPIRYQGRLIGFVLFGAMDSGVEWNEEDIALLHLVCDIFANGMARIENEQEKEFIQQHMQQTQKMEAIGLLTGGIAHDFNNILASIMGFTELAQMREKQFNDDKLRHYLSQIQNAGSRARDLVSQLLIFSKGGSGEKASIDPAPAVREVLRMLQSTLPSSISLETDIDRNLPRLSIDPVQLQQVIMNLMINAKDAMEGKGIIDVRLSVRTIEGICSSCRKPVSGTYLALDVTDEGGGISDYFIERIFDPFFTTKDVGKGTGMGLSVVHGIVHDQGGHIQVVNHSPDGKPKGARFTVLFQLDTAMERIGVQGELFQSEVTDISKSGRVLLVDDELAVAAFLREFLEHMGLEVELFNDPVEALEAFAKEPDNFDMVITDQTMPGMTGLELAAALIQQKPALPVILCSGYSDQVNSESLESLGIKGFLDKPIAIDRLQLLLEEHLPSPVKASTHRMPEPQAADSLS